VETGGDRGEASSAVGGPTTGWKYDVFISHATEDKDLAGPLAMALRAKGLKVWFDAHQMLMGDDIASAVEKGLARSQYGVVILSKVSLDKPWVRQEIQALLTREIETGGKVFLPVWRRGVSRKLLLKRMPLIAGKLAVKSDRDIDCIVTHVLGVLRPVATSERISPSPSARRLWPWGWVGLVALACLVLIAVIVARWQPDDRVSPAQSGPVPMPKPTEPDPRPAPRPRFGRTNLAHNNPQMPLDDAPAWGLSSAPVTVVIWSDVGPACATIESTVRRLRDAPPNKVYVVWKDLVVTFHPHAFEAAAALRAAHAQGEFWKMHEKLCSHRDRLDPSDLDKYAEELRLNVPLFQRDRTEPRIRAAIWADTEQAATSFRLRDVPAVFINNQRLSGELSYESIWSEVADATNMAMR
jgi:hypothetical protein